MCSSIASYGSSQGCFVGTPLLPFAILLLSRYFQKQFASFKDASSNKTILCGLSYLNLLFLRPFINFSVPPPFVSEPRYNRHFYGMFSTALAPTKGTRGRPVLFVLTKFDRLDKLNQPTRVKKDCPTTQNKNKGATPPHNNTKTNYQHIISLQVIRQDL